MKFVYIGAAEKTETLGYSFTCDGAPVDVKEETFIKKLRGNKAFKEVAAKVKKPKADVKFD